MVVRPSTQDLGRHVLKSATDSIGAGSLGQVAGQTKVCQFQMASFIQKDILHLHISMDDAQVMEIAQHQDQLSSKEADGSLSQAANSRPQGVKICAAVAAHCKAAEVWAIFGASCAWAQGIACLLPKPMPPAVPSPFGREQYYKKGNRAKAEQAKGMGNLRWGVQQKYPWE